MEYEHTQRGHFHRLLFAVGALMLAIAATVSGPLAARVVVSVAGVLMVLLGFSLASLTVRDEGEALAVAFGPVPLLRRRIEYRAVRSVRPGRSTWVDGFGVHWLPKRGWIWNLWGFDCVELELDGRRLRIGTDDPGGLAAFLRSRIARESG